MNSAPDPADLPDLPDLPEMVHGWLVRPWVPLAPGARMTVVKKTNSLKLYLPIIPTYYTYYTYYTYLLYLLYLL